MKEDKVIFQCKSLVKQIERYLATSFQTLQELMPNPTISQLRVIGYILSNPNVTYQKDLENALNIRRATVSGILHTMEKNKLIIRESVDDDGRVKKIILTASATKVFKAHIQQLNELEKLLLKNISSEDLNTFYKVLKQMKDNLKN